MRFFLRYGLFLLLPGAVLGMVSDTIAPSHSHYVWDRANGFPGGYVYSITQTADGYLWIGTSKGLLRYDGLSFVNIEGNSSTGTKFPVLSLVTDSSDQLWATDDHTRLFRYSAGLLKGPLSDNGRHPYRVASLNKTREGWPLIASELQGLIEYEHGEPRLLLEPRRVPSRPTAVAQTADGTFWIGTRESGLFSFTTEGAAQKFQRVTGLMNVRVNCLLPMADSTLLIGTEKGLLSLHRGNLIRETLPEISSSEILALTRGLKGDVWIGANGQVLKAQAKDIDTDGRIKSLDHLAVRGTVIALFEDRDGNLWIGEPETMERHRDGAFTTYFSSAGLPCRNCGAIYVDHQERVWFAPWDGGLFRLSQGKIRPIEVAGLKNDAVYSLTGGDDEIWAARKYGGITCLRLQGDGLQASTYTRENGLAQNAIYSIYREPDGTVWAGTLNAGLSRFRGGQWHTFTTKDGLPSNTILAIAGNTAGKIFVGTPDGLAELKDDRWIAYTAKDGLPPGPVESLFWDNADTLWIGTSKGISFLRSGAIHVPLGAPNALYGEIFGIVESSGSLWITTPDRVLRVKCAALLNQTFAEGDYREFGVTEGLPSVAGVKRNRSVVFDDRGRIWFSLEQGISVLQPSAFDEPPFPVTIRMDGVIVDGRSIGSGNQIRIPPGRHRLTFRYVGVNVSNPEGVRYRYRLHGVDSAWSEPTALREIDYTNVPPGQFRFQVIASNPDGVWSDQEATMSLEVEPAYYQTRWFRALYVAIFLALLGAAYQIRVRQLRNEERKFREAVETMPALAFIAMPDGQRTFVNGRWVEYTGLTEKQALGWRWQAAVHPDDLGRVLKRWQESLASGSTLEYEARLRRGADGDYHWFQTRAVPVRDKRGKIIKWYGVINDIEDRKRAEQLQADLAHVNRVSTIGELTASLAHEIKQPIGAAVTNAEACARLLDRAQPDVLEARETALEMAKDARRAAHIIDRVRSLYRKGSSQMDTVDVNEVIGEMLLMLHNEANRHSVNILTDVAEGLPKVMADRVQLQQVLMNLMLNGIQAMEKAGGVLTIKGRLDQDGRVLISVSDTGVGLPTEKTEQIFDAFFTTKPEGSGMGLAISRSIVESHRGRLWATANSGNGATFHFTLPTAAQAPCRDPLSIAHRRGDTD
jgi:PAS domain S-box-containing protein